MAKFQNVFPKGKAFLPVIHVVDLEQTRRNVERARDHNADGVFLISHLRPSVGALRLKDIFHEIHQENHDFFIGINFLDLELDDLPDYLPITSSALWTDDAGIQDGNPIPEERIRRANLFQQLIKDYPGLYFGGVAFKYRRSWKNPAFAAELAVPYMDVITTSGTATGSAPDVTKIRSMREAIGDHPLAIASGIALENVDQFLLYTNAFLVASSLHKEGSETELNPTKVRELAHRIHGTA